MDLATGDQMRAIERAAMAAGTPGLTLMERAGAGATQALFDHAPELRQGRRTARVLCGPGANGGDGYVIARLLAARDWRVEVLAFGDPAQAPEDAAENRRRWEAMGGVVRPLTSHTAAQDGEGTALVVDALFGSGFARAASRELARAAAALPKGGFRLAVDAPLGLSLEDGVARGETLSADLTVTFHRARPGHYLGDGPALRGALAVADIGCEPFDGAAEGPRPRLVEAPTAPLGKDPQGHKYSHGHVLALAGGPAKGGAGRLAARAALRVGAGAVTVGAERAALVENAARLDAIMLRPVDGPDELRGLLGDPRLNAVAMGPGLGVGVETRALVLAALEGAAEAGRGFALDADALTSFEREEREAFFAALRGARAVLTPHAGEFARLFPRAAEAEARLDRARAAAAEAGATVLLKGPDTVVATPEGEVSIHAAVRERAVPWLATAGAGDVLTGLVAGLLARGFEPRASAETAAWLHAEAARRVGPGLIAEDLPEALPGVLAEIA
jgi:hydroxyethylthiazole kinase-like uncharacterized protein yjeF